MANVAIFEPGKEPTYLVSVNTPDYSGNKDALINPDLSSVIDVPEKYWKNDEKSIVEMSSDEKAAIDANYLEKKKAGAETFEVSIVQILTALIEVINIRLPMDQKITKQELIETIKLEIK